MCLPKNWLIKFDVYFILLIEEIDGRTTRSVLNIIWKCKRWLMIYGLSRGKLVIKGDTLRVYCDIALNRTRDFRWIKHLSFILKSMVCEVRWDYDALFLRIFKIECILCVEKLFCHPVILFWNCRIFSAITLTLLILRMWNTTGSFLRKYIFFPVLSILMLNYTVFGAEIFKKMSTKKN